MNRNVDYRAIWPLRGPVKHCTLCRRNVASVFISLKDAPMGERRSHYMCGACLWATVVEALDAKMTEREAHDIHTYLSVDGDPMDVVKEQQAEKERNWRN